ncbi:divergent PAP2 family protein [candidate division TA06 bacterium]|uniref:Divergent PAP2 family protein n=1 Tax=candidate division TA06 bacterium TaxID=2250710 RepID=A0A523XK93_UNCT6|nr:MAG: divergent PAP2 family protein [candidate division TA06 bacterium]
MLAFYDQYRAIILPIVCGLAAQLSKVVSFYIRERKINLKRMTEPGGMPSSHSAAIVALCTVVGVENGINSTVFAVTFLLSLVIMYEAAGLRRAAGEQAEVLNRIVDEFFRDRRVSEGKLKQWLGHTPVEVLAGAAIGFIAGFLFGR